MANMVPRVGSSKRRRWVWRERDFLKVLDGLVELALFLIYSADIEADFDGAFKVGGHS